MPMFKHKSVNDYVAAKEAGDRDATDKIIGEVMDRFNTRTTDGSEAAELHEATTTTRFGSKRR